MLTEDPVQPVSAYAVLPDGGYTIEQVAGDPAAGDPALLFVAGDSLRPQRYSACWLRLVLTNPEPYSTACYVSVFPQLLNTLYYRHAGTGNWHGVSGGMYSPPGGSIYWNNLYCILRGGATDTLYINVSLEGIGTFGRAIRPEILLRQKDYVSEQEYHILLVWGTGAMLLLLFMLNYLYVYRSFREKVILYFLVAQLGGLLYITSYWHVLYQWLPIKEFTMVLTSAGRVHSYDANFLLMHVSVVLILYGLVQLTRSFLLTGRRLPVLDAFLKFSLRGYLLFALVLAFINIFIAQVNYITVPYDNIFCLWIILLIIVTSMAGFRRGFPAAGPYLFANLVPLVLMTGTGLLHIFTEVNGTGDWLPLPAIMAQSLGYSVALVAFIRYLRQSLQQKEREAMDLALEIQEMSFRQRLITFENERIAAEMEDERNKNEALLGKLETNERELASSSLYIVQKNEMLVTLEAEIKELTKRYPDLAKKELTGISSMLKNQLQLDVEWEKFKVHFEQVHPRFFEELQDRYPALTKNEARLYAYFHINLSTKEIARLLNIDPASVRQAKMRLYKKLAAPDAE